MNYEKQELKLLDRQKLEREAFYAGVELYKTRDEVNAKRVESGLEPISIDDVMSSMEEFLLKKV